MVSLEDDIESIEDDWLKVTEYLVDSICRSSQFCNAFGLRERLLILKSKYETIRNILVETMTELENKMSNPKLSKRQKIGVVTSIGIAYPIFKKIQQKSSLEIYSKERRDVGAKIMKIEQEILPKIKNCITILNKRIST